MPDEANYITVQYETFCNSIRQLYDSFYKLATVTFALNGSLGAGFFVAVASDDVFTKTYAPITIAILGAFYNFGAAIFYSYTVKGIHRIANELKGLCNIHDSFGFTMRIVSKWLPKSGHAILIYVFFFLLTLTWFAIMIGELSTKFCN